MESDWIWNVFHIVNDELHYQAIILSDLCSKFQRAASWNDVQFKNMYATLG